MVTRLPQPGRCPTSCPSEKSPFLPRPSSPRAMIPGAPWPASARSRSEDDGESTSAVAHIIGTAPVMLRPDLLHIRDAGRVLIGARPRSPFFAGGPAFLGELFIELPVGSGTGLGHSLGHPETGRGDGNDDGAKRDH